ncbi:helix-turn-helix domain-containing protein [Clostridioides sp. GD02377]|uniref:helix-turn-helix domain-containing protein n=1 Tax=unclassified Clostridioides TaxID=2635829 RepID=UPI0038A32AE1
MNLEKLKNIRIEKGYTHQGLSSLLTISLATYSKRERGIIDFKIEEFENLSKTLGLSEDEVLEVLDLDYIK